MTRHALAAGLLVLLVIASCADAQCKNSTSPIYGKVCPNSKTVCADTAVVATGPIVKITGFYHFSYGCLQGLSVVYGDPKAPLKLRPYMLGTDRKETAVEGKLACKRSSSLSMGLMSLETITDVNLIVSNRKELPNCIEYIRFNTNFGNELAIGRPSASGTKQSTSAPKGGHLRSIRATEFDFARYPSGTSCKAEPLKELAYLGFGDKSCKGRTTGCPVLQQLSFTWSTCA